MISITLNPRITGTQIENKVVAAYLVFREDVRVVETIPFTRHDGAHMNIDVDEQDFPIAIEFVHPDAEEDESSEAKIDDPAQFIIDLFTFATQMVAFHRAHRPALGANLIQKAIQRMRPLERSDLMATT